LAFLATDSCLAVGRYSDAVSVVARPS